MHMCKYKLVCPPIISGKNVPTKINVPNRHILANENVVFDIPSRCSTAFLNSSYCIGSQLCNNLPENIQCSENNLMFDRMISPLYKTYQTLNV